MKQLATKNSLPYPTSFSEYSRFAYSIPALSVKEEKEYLYKWNQKQDKVSAQRLVLSNLYIVVKLVSKHSGYGLPKEDLLQEGTLGLIKAIKKFNTKYTVRLATYAWYWVDAQIKEYIIKNFRLIHLGTSKLAKKLFFGYRKTLKNINDVKHNSNIDNAHLPSHNIGISVEEIARAMDISSRQAHYIHEFFQGKEIDIFSNNASESQNNENHCLENNNAQQEIKTSYMLEYAPTPEDHVLSFENIQKNNMLKEHLNKIIKELPQRNQDIIKSRYLISPPITLSCLSKKYSISIERVRQIEKETLNIVKNKITNFK